MTRTTDDTGVQPDPHHCTYRFTDRPDDGERGCPDWPICLFPTPPPVEPAARVLDDLQPDDEDEIPGLAVTLMSLLGVAVGLALALVVLVLLLPVLL